MLLAEFAKAEHDLQQVRAFVFGEYYLIELHTGKKFDIRDLDTILAVMHDEFELWHEQWVPLVRITGSDYRKGISHGKHRALEIVPVQKNSNFLPTPSMHGIVNNVRKAVTMFNLTGSWDQFIKGNL